MPFLVHVRGVLISPASNILKLYFTIYHTSTFDTKRACTLYVNGFLMMIPNIVTKFQNFDIFEHFVNLALPSAHARRVVIVLTSSAYTVHDLQVTPILDENMSGRN